MLLLRELGGGLVEGGVSFAPTLHDCCTMASMTPLCSGTQGGSYLFLGRSPSRLYRGY